MLRYAALARTTSTSAAGIGSRAGFPTRSSTRLNAATWSRRPLCLAATEPRRKWPLVLAAGVALYCTGASALLLSTSPLPQCVPRVLVMMIEGWRRSARSFFTVTLMGLDYQYSLSGLKRGTEEYEMEKNKAHERCASHLLRLFRMNGGCYIKVGQHMASLIYLLPLEYTSTMSVLQDSAPQSTLDMVELVFFEEFNKKLSDVFVEFDEQPIGSASLAQVHRAVTLDGKEVAVKVQHHGLRDFCDGDVVALTILFNRMMWAFPDFNFQWLIDEVEENLPKELDFENEAKNSERAAQELKDVPYVHIPNVYWELSTKRVLTMEYCHGVKITDVEAIRRLGASPSEVVEKLSSLFSTMIHLSGFVHCDPHPGNILVSNEGGHMRLILLDHGLYKELSEEFRVDYCKLWKALIEFDIDKIKEYSFKLGGGTSYRIFASMLTARSWTAVAQTKTLTKARTPEEMKAIMMTAPKLLKEISTVLAQVPSELLLLLKTNDLLRSINETLDTNVNTYRIIASFCMRGISEHEMRVNPGMVTYMRAWRESMGMSVRLAMYSLLLRIYNLFLPMWGVMPWWHKTER